MDESTVYGTGKVCAMTLDYTRGAITTRIYTMEQTDRSTTIIVDAS
jgi:hypothetical protein